MADAGETRQIEFAAKVPDARDRRNLVFAYAVLIAVNGLLVAALWPSPIVYLLLAGIVLMAGLILWTLLRRPREPRRTIRLFLRPTGYAWKFLAKAPPRDAKFKDYPDLPFVRVDGNALALQVRLCSRLVPPAPTVVFGQALTLRQVNRIHAYVDRRLTPDLHRRVALARDMVPGAGESPTLERVGRASHCPECGYAMAGLPPEMSEGRCPECGWHWRPGDVVIYGRRGPTYGQPRGLMFVPLVLLAGLGGGLIGAAATAVPMLLILWTWRSLPPALSYPATAAVVVGLVAGVVYLIRRASHAGEDARRKADRLGDARTGPAGLACLRLTAGGFAQSPLLKPNVKPRPWAESQNWRVQRWPGGVRVRCDRPGRRHRWWRTRPVDFLCDLADPKADVAALRRRLYDLRDGKG